MIQDNYQLAQITFAKLEHFIYLFIFILSVKVLGTYTQCVSDKV